MAISNVKIIKPDKKFGNKFPFKVGDLLSPRYPRTYLYSDSDTRNTVDKLLAYKREYRHSENAPEPCWITEKEPLVLLDHVFVSFKETRHFDNKNLYQRVQILTFLHVNSSRVIYTTWDDEKTITMFLTRYNPNEV